MVDGLNRKQRRMLQQMENDARAVLAHPPTLRFLCRMLNEVRYFENPFAGNSNTTFVNVGEQEAGRKIVRALESVDPDALLVLLATASKNRSLNSAENEESSDED